MSERVAAALNPCLATAGQSPGGAHLVKSSGFANFNYVGGLLLPAVKVNEGRTRVYGIELYVREVRKVVFRRRAAKIAGLGDTRRRRKTRGERSCTNLAEW